MRLTVLQSFTQTKSTELGDAKFQWTAGRLQGCAAGWPKLGFVEAGPCLLVELGRLHAYGDRVNPAKSARIPWAAVGASLRVERVFSPFFVGIDLGFELPLRHDEFYFRPDRTLHTIPPVVGLAGFDLGVRVP